MPIEYRIPREELNIKGLSIEREQAGNTAGFDPKKDIYEREWKVFENLAAEDLPWLASGSVVPHRLKNLGNLCFLKAETLKRLSSGQMTKLREGLEKTWEYLVEKNSNGETAATTDTLIRAAYSIKKIMPDFLLPLAARNKAIEFCAGVGSGSLTQEVYKNLKILTPNNKLKLAKDFLPELQGSIKLSRSKKSWRSLVSQLAVLRVILPGKFDLQAVDETEWIEIKTKFHSMPPEDQLDFACELAIISADQIEINQSGLHLQSKPKPKILETPPVPKTKNF